LNVSQPATTLDEKRLLDTPSSVLLVEAPDGSGRRQWLKTRLHEAEQRGARTWLLDCDFDRGGPWAGVSDLFASLVDEIEQKRPDLLERHALELSQALPRLQRKLTVNNPTLTDTASQEEKVRNYPVDRAFRLVHGLIDLLDEWKTANGDNRPWVIACDGLDRAGCMASRFFRELIRRRGEKLHLSLLAAVNPAAGEGPCGQFGGGAENRRLSLDPSPEEPAEAIDSPTAAARARELEELAATDGVERRSHLPELIRLWEQAGDPERVLRWKFRGLDTYNSLGLYEDALRYGLDALRLYKELGQDEPPLHWAIFIKLFMCYVGMREPWAAYRLAEEEALPRDLSHAWRGQLYYLLSMLHARYFPERDFGKAEEYLDLGLELLEQSDLDEGDRHFQCVFNRNGLAMIRHFQRRHEEAIELCRSGYERLSSHLGEDRHRLHRSVLLYNIAQVKMAMGSYDEAIEHYTAAMAMDPNYSEYYNERGSVFLRLGRLEEALVDYRQSIELSPPYHEVFTNLGQCHRRRGEFALALEAYSRALDLEPDQVLPWAGRAKAREEMGFRDEAIADYSAALALDPAQWDVLASRAVLRYEAGQLEESLEDLGKAIDLSPEQADLYSNRAIVLADLGRHREASRDLERYLQLAPQSEDRTDVEKLPEEAPGD
jgi:tetratricopeptide (TPR) repeat protein